MYQPELNENAPLKNVEDPSQQSIKRK